MYTIKKRCIFLLPQVCFLFSSAMAHYHAVCQKLKPLHQCVYVNKPGYTSLAVLIQST